MIDYDKAQTLTVSILGFGAAFLAYCGSKHAKNTAGEADEDDSSIDFIQAQFVKIEADRDNLRTELEQERAALRELENDRNETARITFENVITLIDIVKRLAYMLASVRGAAGKRNQREILAILSYRQFAAKRELIGELETMFHVQAPEAHEPGAIPKTLPPDFERDTA